MFSAGNVEELVMCVVASAGGSLSIVLIANCLPAHLDDADAFMKRPFCFLRVCIFSAGARLLLLNGYTRFCASVDVAYSSETM